MCSTYFLFLIELPKTVKNSCENLWPKFPLLLWYWHSLRMCKVCLALCTCTNLSETRKSSFFERVKGNNLCVHPQFTANCFKIKYFIKKFLASCRKLLRSVKNTSHLLLHMTSAHYIIYDNQISRSFVSGNCSMEFAEFLMIKARISSIAKVGGGW